MIYKINNLSFSYNNSNKVLNNINLEIKEGDLILLLGKNGSGKSTLFSLMMGLNNKYEGSVLLNDKEISKLKEKEIASNISYVFQTHSPTFGYTVLDFILLGLANKLSIFQAPTKKDIEQVDEVLKELDIYHLRDKDYSELSGGELQIVTIARAIVSKPKMLIFDEPTSHLDYSNTIKILKLIKTLNEKGYTIAMSTHDPNHALILNSKVALLDNKGSIKVGNTPEMITESNLKEIYGNDIKIRYNEEFKCNICILKI